MGTTRAALKPENGNSLRGYPRHFASLSILRMVAIHLLSRNQSESYSASRKQLVDGFPRLSSSISSNSTRGKAC